MERQKRDRFDHKSGDTSYVLDEKANEASFRSIEVNHSPRATVCKTIPYAASEKEGLSDTCLPSVTYWSWRVGGCAPLGTNCLLPDCVARIVEVDLDCVSIFIFWSVGLGASCSFTDNP